MKTIAGIIFAVAAIAAAQTTDATSPEARLQAKQSARLAERAMLASITVGELEDLKAELQRLRAMNAALTEKLTRAAAAPARKRYTTIEVGMTKDELMLFVKQRPREMRVTGFSVSAGGTAVNQSQTIVVRKEDGTNLPAPTAHTTDQTTEKRVVKNKKESLKVEFLEAKYATVGLARNESRTVTYQPTGGGFRVELIDDVVIEVQAYR